MGTTLATDKFYYIMDYSGNYYRTDSSDQLVVAGDKNEATVFSYVDANKRVSGGMKSKFYFMTSVENIDDETEEVDEIEEVDETEEIDEMEEVSTARELTVAEIKDEVEKSMSEYDISRIDWKEYLTHFIFITANIREYHDELIKAESDVDQKICDVLHYIELCDIEEGESEDLVELLRVCRENRRSIKDELLKLEAFQKNIGTSANTAKAKEALKVINSLKNRKYVPRKFTELFEGSEIKKRNSSIVRRENYIPENNNDEIKDLYAMEDEIMDYEKRETVFDGKKNDWMAFAMQQAEFYKNAGQYITNLRIEIDEIDGAISDLIDEIETANCNVAQGYKMFKKLKEFRLERKEKERELECLYILTERFDLGVMAEECESNVDTMSSYLYGDSTDEMSEEAEMVEEADEPVQEESSEAMPSTVDTNISDIAV